MVDDCGEALPTAESRTPERAVVAENGSFGALLAAGWAVSKVDECSRALCRTGTGSFSSEEKYYRAAPRRSQPRHAAPRGHERRLEQVLFAVPHSANSELLCRHLRMVREAVAVEIGGLEGLNAEEGPGKKFDPGSGMPEHQSVTAFT